MTYNVYTVGNKTVRLTRAKSDIAQLHSTWIPKHSITKTDSRTNGNTICLQNVFFDNVSFQKKMNHCLFRFKKKMYS